MSGTVSLGGSEATAFERLNGEFIRLLVAGSAPISFAERLAHYVGCPVIVENALHEVVAYAGGTADADALVRDWPEHATLSHLHGDEAGHAATGSIQHRLACARQAVEVRGESWGWVHVLHDAGEGLSRAGVAALGRTSEVISITILGDRDNGTRSTQRQASLLSRLISGDLSGTDFTQRAIRVGRDLRDRPLVVVAAVPGPSAEADVLFERLLRPAGAPFVQAPVGEHVMAVVGLTRQLTVPLLVDRLDDEGVRAGVSRVVAPGQLPWAVRQARVAVAAAAGSARPRALQFDGLGVLRLLVALDEGTELQRFVDDEIGELLAHDAGPGNPLLPTLRAYLAAGGNKARTAEALFVQRRTLYYRLERIDSLIGRSLDDPETRTVLDIALRGWDYLQSGDRGADWV